MCDYRSRPRRNWRRGFSLVEVALAVAVLAVALVGLLALMPSGVGNFRKAMDTSITSQIAQRILQDAEQAEFDALVDLPHLPPDPEGLSYCPERFSFRAPKVGVPAWRYFDESGTEVHPASKDGKLSTAERRIIVYQVNTRIRPRAELPTINESSGHVAQLTVQIARNPGTVELPIESNSKVPEHNLFKTGLNVPVFTYCALIGRNSGR
jgi:prepilin-type N-terminal cleavage/methylation domain-containing protein